MKKIAAILLVAGASLSVPAAADQYVRPHVRSDGTFVEGHMRSSPNSSRFDNYSSQGNSNPYTGQRGSQRSELSDPPSYNKIPSLPALPSSPYDGAGYRRSNTGR